MSSSEDEDFQYLHRVKRLRQALLDEFGSMLDDPNARAILGKNLFENVLINSKDIITSTIVKPSTESELIQIKAEMMIFFEEVYQKRKTPVAIVDLDSSSSDVETADSSSSDVETAGKIPWRMPRRINLAENRDQVIRQNNRQQNNRALEASPTIPPFNPAVPPPGYNVAVQAQQMMLPIPEPSYSANSNTSWSTHTSPANFDSSQCSTSDHMVSPFDGSRHQNQSGISSSNTPQTYREHREKQLNFQQHQHARKRPQNPRGNHNNMSKRGKVGNSAYHRDERRQNHHGSYRNEPSRGRERPRSRSRGEGRYNDEETGYSQTPRCPPQQSFAKQSSHLETVTSSQSLPAHSPDPARSSHITPTHPTPKSKAPEKQQEKAVSERFSSKISETSEVSTSNLPAINSTLTSDLSEVDSIPTLATLLNNLDPALPIQADPIPSLPATSTQMLPEVTDAPISDYLRTVDRIKQENDLDILLETEAVVGSTSTSKASSEPQISSDQQQIPEFISLEKIKKENDLIRKSFYKGHSSETDINEFSDKSSVERKKKLTKKRLKDSSDDSDFEKFADDFAEMADDPEFLARVGSAVEIASKIRTAPQPHEVSTPASPPVKMKRELHTAEDEAREDELEQLKSDERLKDLNAIYGELDGSDIEPSNWLQCNIVMAPSTPDFYTPQSPLLDDDNWEDLEAGDETEDIVPYDPQASPPSMQPSEEFKQEFVDFC